MPPRSASAQQNYNAARQQRRAGFQSGTQPSSQPSGKAAYMKGTSIGTSNVGNVLLAFKQEPTVMNLFGFDEMLQTPVLIRPLFTNDPNFTPRPATDADATAVQKWLQWFGFRKLGQDTTHQAIAAHARDNAFHPVRDYLSSLTWDC